MRHKLRVSDYPDGMRLDEISTRIKEAKAAAQVEALAAEDAAAHNYQEIRKLGRQLEAATEHRQRMTARMRDLERRNTKLERRVEMLDRELEEQFRPGCSALENDLADACRNHALLVRLVERVGHNLAVISGEGWDNTDYTVAEQRRLDAEAHEAEGPPPDAGMLENVQ